MQAAEIEARSYAISQELVPDHLLPFDAAGRAVVRRMIYSVGDPSIAPQIRIPDGAADVGVAALRQGCPIFTDVQMIAVGINANLARRVGSTVTCMLADSRVAERARLDGTTRSIAAVRLCAPQLDGAIVAIGNAPTALLALLDLIDAGTCRPALVVGVPVGFVNTAESKVELLQRAIPYITLLGYRGGSPVAVGAVNALLKLATGQIEPGIQYREP